MWQAEKLGIKTLQNHSYDKMLNTLVREKAQHDVICFWTSNIIQKGTQKWVPRKYTEYKKSGKTKRSFEVTPQPKESTLHLNSDRKSTKDTIDPRYTSKQTKLKSKYKM